MTTLISLDIGFDWHALSKEGNRPSGSGDSDCPQLRYGFTVPGKKGNPVFMASQWHRGDGMLLTLYNQTKDSAPTIESLSLKLRFQPALKQKAESPVRYPGKAAGIDPLEYLNQQFAIHPIIAPEGYSTVFENCYPSWHIYPPQQASPKYPYNQLLDSRKPPEKCLEVKEFGSFYYSIELLVGAGGSSRTFRVDPEMVVDSNGQTPPDEN